MALEKSELSTPRVFQPYGTVMVNATTASGTTANALVLDTGATSTEQRIIRIANPGGVSVRFALGGTAAATGTASPIVLAQTVEMFDRGTSTHIALATISGTSDNVTITTGIGV